ncbi:hypothetical protein HME9302_00616 [Alteripontixanthobacter maritimus]|uniref:Uncharacterized protein n=1 Tax=Alteripontixanthobacter maritimus TaxID=2161824 RepID=A0A369QAY5_9SPHN|nr:hypothetical protein [Alteripontixanthobacter maritimus]RDC59428.1 hypothetical protein HME9302_00616 [Alteripontixanthobacter maritimus]
MTIPATEITVMASASLLALFILTAAILHGWLGWLALKERELDRLGAPHGILLEIEGGAPVHGSIAGAARIEIADLKERIRKLEAIASGVEL